MIGLALIVAGIGPARAASDEITPAARTSSAACPAATDEQKVDTARAWHEEINRRNPAALSDILAPDMVHHAAGGRPGSRGHPAAVDAGGVAAMMRRLLSAFPDLKYTPDQFIVRDDYVVERYTATGTQKGRLQELAPSGRRVSWTGINIYRLQCGRIAEVWSELDAVSRNRQLTGSLRGNDGDDAGRNRGRSSHP